MLLEFDENTEDTQNLRVIQMSAPEHTHTHITMIIFRIIIIIIIDVGAVVWVPCYRAA